jgi:cell division protease FtsH
VLLGGRAAESLMYDEVSTGAGDDLAKATDVARSMVMRYGMDATLGQVSYDEEPAPLLGGSPQWHERRYGEATATAIDAAVRALIEDAFQRAVAILTANRTLLDEAAKELLAKETFSSDELSSIAAKLGTARL